MNLHQNGPVYHSIQGILLYITWNLCRAVLDLPVYPKSTAAPLNTMTRAYETMRQGDDGIFFEGIYNSTIKEHLQFSPRAQREER